MDNTDQLIYWNEVAGAKWVANQVRLDRLFAPLTRALLDVAAPRPDERVWDIGCGCGDISLALAGRTCHVRAADISRPMLEQARARDTRGAIDFIEADAMTFPFEPEADLLVSRFGVMFFADSLHAFTNLRRALKPGGRLACLCWQTRPSVEWMQWPLDQVARVLPVPPETTGEPGPFGLADKDVTLAMLAKAGFSDVTATSVTPALTIGEGTDPVADAVAVLLETGPLGRLLRDAGPAERSQAEPLLRSALEAKVSGGVIELGSACWLYQGVAR